MRIDQVEIYSDMRNSAVLRHPGRHFPGVLIQGGSLYVLCWKADEVCRTIGRGAPGYKEANELRNTLWSYLTHYKSVLGDHNVQIPFSEDYAP